jgi:hypothetical protein
LNLPFSKSLSHVWPKLKPKPMPPRSSWRSLLSINESNRSQSNEIDFTVVFMPKISSNDIFGLIASTELIFKFSKLEEGLASKLDEGAVFELD